MPIDANPPPQAATTSVADDAPPKRMRQENAGVAVSERRTRLGCLRNGWSDRFTGAGPSCSAKSAKMGLRPLPTSGQADCSVRNRPKNQPASNL